MKLAVQCGKSLMNVSNLKFWYDDKYCKRIVSGVKHLEEGDVKGAFKS
jgi:hypothetical protein